MKKNLLFGIALLAITLCFTGCPNPNGDNGDGTKTVTVKNADVLFVTNTSENNQGYDEQIKKISLEKGKDFLVNIGKLNFKNFNK